MRSVLTALGAAVALASAAPAAAQNAPAAPSPQDTIGQVRYLAGSAHVEKLVPNLHRAGRVDGWLIATDSLLEFRNDKGQLLLAVPLREITDVKDAVENKNPSKTARVMFGVLATGSRDETVTVTRESAQTAEAIVFKVRTANTAPGMLTKIRFHLRRVG